VASHAEQLDIFDDTGRHVGTKGRDAVHRDGDWHQVFHVLIVRPGADPDPTVVLQRRSETKAAFAGLVDLSATGHLEAGEQPRDGIRELAEELGITVEPADLVPLGFRRIVEASGEGKLNKEMANLFLLSDQRPLEDYRPDPLEVSDVIESGIDGLLDLYAGRTDAVAARCGRGGPTSTCSLDHADFVPGDQYWITALVMAQRFAAGLTPLAI
jgi:isopentenyldiphosphate isomerase